MRNAVIAVAVSLVSILCIFQATLADDLFYSGDIVTESVGINIDIDHQEATVSAVYLLKNRSSEIEEVNLQYDYPPASLQMDGEALANPVVFNRGETKSVTATFKLNITGETTKTLYLVPTLLFNGSPNSEPAMTVMIKALLPEGINGLAWASQEPDEESLESGRKHYTWKDVDVYPTPLTLKWSTLEVDLSIEKSASPIEITQPDQLINIEIALKNNGDTELNDIQLVDQYSASHFGEIEPSTESGTRENLVFWQKTISSVIPGEAISLNYSVKYIASISQVHEFDLKPTVVTVDGNLVSVSNKVRMKLGAELPTLTPEPATPTPTPIPAPANKANIGVIVGAVVAVIFIVLVAYWFLSRRNKPR